MTHLPRREPTPRWTRYVAGAALIVSTVAVIVVLVWGAADRPGIGRGTIPSAIHVPLVLLACIAYLTMIGAQRRWGGLRMPLVTIALGAQYVAAIAAPPRSTRDLWWYAIYGRVAGIHHANPYITVPAKFPGDVLLHVTPGGFAHEPSVYGPLFTGISSSAAKVLGTSLLATRLFYQGLAFAAIAVCCLILWRHTRSIAALAFAGAHPLIALGLVNGGKNDALVGLALLGAVVLSLRGHNRAAGFVGALGALVKVTGLVGLAVVIVVVVRTRGWRAARQCIVTAAGVIAVGYALVGSAAVLTPMNTAGALFTRASVWKLFPILDLGKPSSGVALAVMALVVVVMLKRAPSRRVDTAVTETMTAMTLAAPYTLGAYVGWSLPTAALDHQSRVSRISMSFGVVLVAAYEVFRHPTNAVLTAIASTAAPVAALVLLVLILRRGHRPAEAASLRQRFHKNPDIESLGNGHNRGIHHPQR